MQWATSDLCDAHDDVQVAEPRLRHVGGVTQFCGPVVTLKLFEDNSLVRSTLEEPGAGRVLVVDGGGSLRCALVGDQIAALAVRNAWAGIVVYGCVRDSAELGQLPIGIMALATHPRRSVKRGEGQRDLPVTFLGVTIRPGSYVYADADGLIVAETEL
ncbi:S-adenosylmethionine:2-demethylmenaquinone methyltransferase [Oscillochloris trichoides DG-6]|uniref:4-hydroxy-4-methyl-2-oxoglutarate aldolase n=1 Tax=Oscillochloris trichoides DG-6 TaxID=765420 RepID=E1IDY0_9CHLR|nr:ribonuclease E activity regulator RraA [Oscillochloris trichoides]EFO80591.1 S-adenosylmethionine:2-demethylmenaquinone methyltransferase [Oscillochloris trichoides DG-6]